MTTWHCRECYEVFKTADDAVKHRKKTGHSFKPVKL